VIVISGDLDIDTAVLLRMTLLRALDDHDRVCCDISEVGFFGAAGLNALLSARLYAVERRRILLVRGAHGLAERVLAITGLNEVFDRPDDDRAARSLRPGRRPGWHDPGE
jgi:anti-anti-sigma factor